mmetsp:Transcript_11370/g.24160  ORF Transcript_11370/g.24160 Transcript_11370/m.24160 type:complete len:522 (-) Transcript_11370:49-1614(-)
MPMAHQQSPAPQPRGLPGFLRRTFRNSYDEDLPSDPALTVTPSAAPRTPSQLTSQSNNSKDVDVSVGEADDDGECGLLNESFSELAVNGDTEVQANEVNKHATPAKATLIDSSPASRSGSVGSFGSTGSSTKKQLRSVAFPPLPLEREESEGKNTPNNLHAAAASQIQDINFVSNTRSANISPNLTSKPPKSYKETQFDAIIASNLISLRDLRKLAWNGIPRHHRPLAWKILLGYLPANTSRHKQTLTRKRSEYKDAMKQHYDIPDDSRTNSEQETLRQVLVDVPRTAPEVPLFHNDRIRRCLSRLLYIWAMRHPASSYVQGINDLATPLISVFLSGYFDGKDCLSGEIMADVTDEMLEEVEADTYWCLTNLLAGIQDHYTSDQPGMQRMVMKLEELVNRIDADLALHLRNTGIEFMQFAFKWMNCLLLREFRLECVMRLWDTYLSEDGGFEDFHVYVCASFLVHFSGELQQMGFDELFQFMQNIPTDDWGDREVEILLSSAYVLSTLFGGSEAHLNVVRN